MYPRDLLADTLHLTLEQFGAYSKLLFVAWVGVEQAEQGYLPADDRLPAILGITPARWRKIGAPVLALFREDEDGRRFNKRLLAELDRQRERSASARDSARRRWEPWDGEPSESRKPNRDGAPSVSESRKKVGEPPSLDDANALRRQCGGDAAREAADANAYAVVGKREREGERVQPPPDRGPDLAPYRRLLRVLHPRAPELDDLAAWATIDAALRDQAQRGRLPPAAEFGAWLWRWSQSGDWREQDGRFVPPPATYVRRDSWRLPRQFAAESDPGGWQAHAEVARILAGIAA